MNSRLPSAIGFAVLSMLAVAPAAFGEDPPPIFDKRPYEEAKKAAETDKKWFVVKATAVWCGPCKQMDKTTWRDEKVVDWFKNNGIAFVVDVDKEKKISGSLEIQAMPTMIAFKDGKEFDRIVGYKSPDEFLGWLEGIAKGEKSIEKTRKKAGNRDGKKVDVRARMDLAEELERTGKHDESADEYVWLWQHMLEHEPAMSGVRRSFMLSDMQQLAKHSESAKKKFLSLRDETGKSLDGDQVDVDDVADWVALNKVVGEPGDTLRWYDKIKGKRRWRPIINRVADDIEELLIARDRWEDLGLLYADPMAEFRKQRDFLKMLKAMPPRHMDAEQRKALHDSNKQRFREKIGYLYAGLLAADLEEKSAQLAEEARKYDKSTDMLAALIETALEAEEPRPEHVEWLKEAEKEDSSLERLRTQAEAALKSKK